MMNQGQRKLVWILIGALFLFGAVVSEVISPQHDQYMVAQGAARDEDLTEVEVKNSIVKDTPFQALLPTLLGVREVIASLMWVQADDYFHRGEYRPIISLIRQITTIDPHQLDVYATGAWHMAYNFMDKRLIEDGVRFLQDGCKNNSSVYDLFFELGYMHYDKTRDYPAAVEAYREASTKSTTTGKKLPPSYVRHQLAHALEKMGDIDQCVAQWQANLELARQLAAKGEADNGPGGTNTDAARHNLYITERRRNERLAAVAEREGRKDEALRRWQDNVKLANDWLKDEPTRTDIAGDKQVADNQVSRIQSKGLIPLDLTDPKVTFKIERQDSKKLLITGTADVLNLSRMNIRFADKDYLERIASQPKEAQFDYKMRHCTLEFDNVSIRQGKFRWLLDLDKDPADMGRAPTEIYPLDAPEYTVTFTYSPRYQASFIQDRYGWNGEGLTAPPDQLVIDESRAGIIEGKRIPLRMVRREVVLKREDVLAKGKAVLADVK